MADYADARRRAEEALRYDHDHANSPEVRRRLRGAVEALLAAGPEAKAPGHDRIAELESLLRECNAVCLCGCPESEHEADECGESCDDEDHECIRVPRAVLAYVERLRSAAPPPSDAVREAAEAQFGRALLPLWWDDGNPGDIDGSAAQDAAEASGLWRRVERHADGVECEWCNNEEPCGELTEIGRSALRSDGR